MHQRPRAPGSAVDFSRVYCFGASSRAVPGSMNPQLLCLPSQNGLFPDSPQRQRKMVSRPPRPYALPSLSTSVKSPVTLYYPFSFTVMIAAISVLLMDGDDSSYHVKHPEEGRVPHGKREATTPGRRRIFALRFSLSLVILERNSLRTPLSGLWHMCDGAAADMKRWTAGYTENRPFLSAG